MGYKQPNNPMKMMKSALKMYKADKKAGMHRDSAMYMNSPMYMGHESPAKMGHESPAEMGHSPMEMGHESPAKNVNKGYGYEVPKRSALKRESAELKDMPIVDIEKGKAKGDMKKGSPAKAAKPDYPDIDKDGDTSESMKKAAADKKKGSPAKMGHEKDRKDAKKEQPKSKRTYGSPAKMKDKKSPAKMGHKDSPAKKYDRVVLGGNKGDKSKTKPGKKDYEK
tara:strand:+ start:458 stop:1126 length:669 start_codon:yes stop_codon:yes gene_type:complete